jgi:hypothetical protein
VIFAEVLDRRGQVRQRVRIDHLPLTIGRAYTNDLILDDRYVCPQHARVSIREGEGLVAEDLDSVNGLFDASTRQRVRRLPLQSGSQIRLGHSVVRFRTADHRVDATALEVPNWRVIEWLGSHWTAALLMLGSVFGLLLLQDYQATYREVATLTLISDSLAAILTLAGWSGAWALVTRLLHHQTRFVTHWMIAGGFLLASSATEWLASYARFFCAGIDPVDVAELVAGMGFGGLALFGHLSAAQVLRPARRALAALLVSVAVLGSFQLDSFANRPDWTRVLPYWSRLKPLEPGWLPVESADAFFANSAALKAEVDRLAREDD